MHSGGLKSNRSRGSSNQIAFDSTAGKQTTKDYTNKGVPVSQKEII